MLAMLSYRESSLSCDSSFIESQHLELGGLSRAVVLKEGSADTRGSLKPFQGICKVNPFLITILIMILKNHK